MQRRKKITPIVVRHEVRERVLEQGLSESVPANEKVCMTSQAVKMKEVRR
jgi:hypothetical protein